MSVEPSLELWFNTGPEFYMAANQLDLLDLVPYSQPGVHYILLKERGTSRMGFGFYDLELGLMCKLAL